MTGTLLDLLSNAEVYDLGQPLEIGMPQSRDHPTFRMNITRRHGDLVRLDGGSGSTEIIITGGHVGTHIDALSHASYEGRLHGGIAVADAMKNGRYIVHGAETVGPWVCRGVLLDIPPILGVPHLSGAQEITPEMLESAAQAQGVEFRDGDVILVRSGWGSLFVDPVAFQGELTGTPGINADAARWLAQHRPRAVGGDTIAFERITPPDRPIALPAHVVLLVEHGIYVIETMDLERLAADGIHEFAFVLAPLPLVGATGAPVRPLALVER